MENIHSFKPMTELLSLQDAIKEAHRCLLCHDAPCSKACPAGTDPGKFIRQIRFENFKGAARTIRKNNPMGRVCAFVCPVEELCERECSVKALEEPINIAGLQQFASEYGERFSLEPLRKSTKQKGKVAIIGAGPAGIACASELADVDYDVTIFERESQPGGVPKWAIPAFRLPQEAIDYDLNNLKARGVKIVLNKNIDTPSKAEALLKRGFSAMFIATGLTGGFSLDVLNGYSNAMTSNRFLYQVEADRKKARLTGKVVAVIGGGSVAMDSASTAMALGAKKVYIIYRRTMHEMPAAEAEILVAQSMNVTFRTLSIIREVIAIGKKITYLKGIEVEWISIDGKKTAKEIPGTEFGVAVDLVIQAIGSMPGEETSRLVKGMKCSKSGTIAVKKDFSTNIPGIFAGGDIVNGGRTVVQAVGEGKKAALTIDRYMKKHC
ncbi:MAG: FAD-dependent oxidoreductase [Bacteroidetes bacterium]|nr:FAD-dependent oxidoreductase [Bacteroidota bacterium]